MSFAAMSPSLMESEPSLEFEKGMPSKGSHFGFLARFDGGVGFLSPSSSDAFLLVGVEGVDDG